jgi:hypothetical protein
MDLLIKIKTNDDLTLDEIRALSAQSRALDVSPEQLAARYLREGLAREESSAKINEDVR